ncbi:hypothetical protein METBIDRAFT_46586 [Metschnikowia bicuspidata var. bicuspidata NRRL YB-4993]|uniref:Uncharacterized protein n=1 Tax=Metschnikowia bicuspidata var. bicuspidata NRRL YB-4993 TaxID=869754 RepID=A0A1A0H5K2_9ASCO|nr:hypothetical protein METBIDRAFT_46586 [Metschnikowia bicuspidata var. bicuspidata NRRL YB-4993]OBA19321.1 hypothetical protein METBIDRAFT_46586 [Metschnikowia bicuspidata var. bicuspidata NRRL YB-4993]
MNYINTNFLTLLDLDDLDARVSSLNEERKILSDQILARSSREHPQSPNELPLQVVELMQKVSGQPCTLTPASVDKLKEKYGNLAFLSRLHSILESKESLTLQCEVLRAGATIEQQIIQLSGESSIQEFAEIADQISNIKGRDLISAELQTQLTTAMEYKRASLSSMLSSHLSEIKWLSATEKVTIDSEKFKTISTLLSDLIRLQASDAVPQYPEVWWGLETLLSPFAQRFNFHFRDTSETNKLTKPEWALNYVEEFLNENLPTLEFVVGDTFLQFEKIGAYEILSTVLSPVREKLESMLEVINQKISSSQDDEKAIDRYGRLLSHLIFEATTFDQRIRNSYKYNPFIKELDLVPEKKWMGLTGDILLSNDKESISVNNWLNLELRLAKNRFDTEIISPKNAFEIDYEFTASSDFPESMVKPTYSAYGLSKLFDNLTSHFKTINIVKYQLKYVSQIQLVFLDQYLEELQKQFRKFNESLSLKIISSFMKSSVKNETGSTTQTVVTNGLTGLEMLTGIYCLTKFVISKMEEWAENLIYIQLWNYCQSSSEYSGESIFDASINDYKTLLSKVSNKYEEFFRKEVRGALRDYVNDSTWNIEDPQYVPQVSLSLSGFTTTIPAYTSYLKRSLLDIDFTIISSKICDSYAHILLEYVITNNQFNKRGLEQLQTDIHYLDSILKDHLLLDHLHKYSNSGNKSYKKVFQSIEMMNRFDASGAKLLKKQFLNGETIRSQFESRLDCLSDSECLDLLFRII